MAYGTAVAGTTTRPNPFVQYFGLSNVSIAKGRVCYTNDAGFIVIATAAENDRPFFVTVKAVDNSAGSAGAVPVPIVGAGQYVTVQTKSILSPGDPVKVSSTDGMVTLLVIDTDALALKVGVYTGKVSGTVSKSTSTPYAETFTDGGDYNVSDAAVDDIVEILIGV